MGRGVAECGLAVVPWRRKYPSIRSGSCIEARGCAWDECGDGIEPQGIWPSAWMLVRSRAAGRAQGAGPRRVSSTRPGSMGLPSRGWCRLAAGGRLVSTRSRIGASARPTMQECPRPHPVHQLLAVDRGSGRSTSARSMCGSTASFPAPAEASSSQRARGRTGRSPSTFVREETTMSGRACTLIGATAQGSRQCRVSVAALNYAPMTCR